METTYILFLLTFGIGIGFIMMASTYNLFLYIAHKEKIFLYYSLMQIGLTVVLLYDSKILQYFYQSQNENSIIYKFFSYFTLTFIILFTREFFETSTRIPTLDKMMRYQIQFILFSGLFLNYFIIFDYGLYLFIFLFILYVAYRSHKQGFIWAKYFLVGWGILITTIFLDAFFIFDVKPFSFNPMLIGAVIEAMVLTFVIAYKFKALKEEREKEQLLLSQQSKLASLGELLGNIAHQWRQPLSRLSLMLLNAQVSEDKDRNKHFEDAYKELEYMSESIDDFKDFYAPSKNKSYFSILNTLHKVLSLIDLKEIKINIDIDKEVEVFGYQNASGHVLLNILNNAKEILIKRKIKNPTIHIIIRDKTIIIQDNGGGIKKEIIDKIFEPYVSDKEGGLGIGLYMSKMVIEQQIKGSIKAENTDKGAKFTICLEKQDQ